MTTTTAKITDLAEIFGTTERGARLILAEAGAKPAARGAWPMPGTLRAVFEHLRRARQSSDVSRARAAHLAAQARRTDLATARAERDVIPLADAALALDVLAGATREELQGLAARLTRDRAERARFERETRATMQRLANTLNATAAALAAGNFDAISDFQE